MDQLLNRLFTLYAQNQIEEVAQTMLKHVEINEQMTFVECWFKQKKIECSSMVRTWLTKYSIYYRPIFSININPKVIEYSEAAFGKVFFLFCSLCVTTTLAQCIL